MTPSFQQGGFLEETIRSVLLQNYPALEYLVLDGGSRDESESILRRYEPWLAGWESRPDEGQSDAINQGLRRSTGELWNWLNSDDVLEMGALRAIAEGFAPPGVRAVSGRERRFGEGVRTTVHQGTPRDDRLERTLFVGHLDQPCTYFRRADVQALGGLDTTLHWGMDLDFYMRFLCRYGQDGIRSIDEVVSNFRLHPDSKTVRQDAGAREEDRRLRWSFRVTWGEQLGLDASLLDTVRHTFGTRRVRPYPVAVDLDRGLLEYFFMDELVSYFYFRRQDREARAWLRRLRRNPHHRWRRRSLVLHSRLFLLPPVLSRAFADRDPHLGG